ncbi:MAG: IPT/TIG domain-containing protein [Fimbriimonadaceae bacterium]
MKKLGFAVAVLTVLACGGTNLNPIAPPVINNLSVNSASAGSPDLLIQVNGEDFLPGAVVRFNGNNKSSLLISSSAITATIPAADMATAGVFPITVKNPDGTVSNSSDFTVN